MWNDRGAIIGKLRILAPSPDPVVAGLRAQAALSELDITRYNLSRSACLFIQKLDDPLPERISLHHRDAHVPEKWKQAFGHKLGLLACAAARPAHGIVPAASNAVLFADESELLACLARDWCDGILLSRWWWREILRHRDASRIVHEYWLSAPIFVPAAIDLLNSTGDALRFAAALTEHDAALLLERVVHSHGLVSLMPVLSHLTSSCSLPHDERSRAVEFKPATSGNQVDFAGDIPAYRFMSPVISVQLKASQCMLLDVCIGLRQEPFIVRSGAYAEAMAALFKGSHNQPADRSAIAKAESSSPPEQGTGKAANLIAQVERGRKRQLSKDQPQAAADSSARGFRISYTPLPASADRTANGIAPIKEAHSDSRAVSETASSLLADSRKQLQPEESTWIVNTQLGGAFYLINLGIFLGLYGDFTSPLHPGIELSIWDFVALAAARLVPRRHDEDAVWNLLSKLACRPIGQKPGADFAAPGEWRMPEFWLAPFNETLVWQARQDDSRLRVIHPEGFSVIDVPLKSANPEMLLAREMSPYLTTARTRLLPEWAPFRKQSAPGREHAPARWLEWLMPYIRARLARALGIESGRKAGRFLCCHEARITVTPAHLDIVFSIASLPIQIRISGLDRDPGWVPAAGRVLRFHYE